MQSKSCIIDLLVTNVDVFIGIPPPGDSILGAVPESRMLSHSMRIRTHSPNNEDSPLQTSDSSSMMSLENSSLDPLTPDSTTTTLSMNSFTPVIL